MSQQHQPQSQFGHQSSQQPYGQPQQSMGGGGGMQQSSMGGGGMQQPSMGGGGMIGQQQPTSTMGQGGLQQTGMPEQKRQAVEELTAALETCEWCADQCIAMGSPEMTECIRLCRDTSDLAGIALELVGRDSRFSPQIINTFARAARECASECAHHDAPHCQECASTLPRVADAVEQYAASLGGGMGGGMGGGQMQQPQMQQQPQGQQLGMGGSQPSTQF